MKYHFGREKSYSLSEVQTYTNNIHQSLNHDIILLFFKHSEPKKIVLNHIYSTLIPGSSFLSLPSAAIQVYDYVFHHIKYVIKNIKTDWERESRKGFYPGQREMLYPAPGGPHQLAQDHKVQCMFNLIPKKWAQKIWNKFGWIWLHKETKDCLIEQEKMW